MHRYIFVNGSEFIGKDTPSGGYPYSTSRIESVYMSDDPANLLKWFGDTGINMFPNAYMCKIEFKLTPVDHKELTESVREKVLAKLSKSERQILGL